jgi:AcrR family transcriptional regulator
MTPFSHRNRAGTSIIKETVLVAHQHTRSGRSQATSRNSERTRGLLLQAAFQEMHRSGFRSADLDTILAKAGVTKGALYYHFDNKEASAMRWWTKSWQVTFTRSGCSLYGTPRTRSDVLIRIVQSEPLKRADVQRLAVS